MPHEVMRMDPVDLTMAVVCADAAVGATNRLCEQINWNKGMVFPVVVLGD